MLWSRWLKSDEDLAVFQREFRTRSGNPVDLSYLKRAKTRGYFTNKGEMLGGYVIGTSAPLRYLTWLSPEAAQRRSEDRYGPEDFTEITCIWMLPKRINAYARGQIYLESIAFALLTGKPAILGGTFVERVFKQQTQVMRYLYRDGLSTFRANASPFWLYYGQRTEMPYLFLKQMVLFCLAAGARHRRKLWGRISSRWTVGTGASESYEKDLTKDGG